MNINEGLLRNVNAASGGEKMGRGVRVRGRSVQKAVWLKAFKKLCQIFLFLRRGNVSGCFIFMKTRVTEQILIRG